MTTVYEPIATGTWHCAEHVIAGSACELDGQGWVGYQFPPEIVDLDRVWRDGPSQLASAPDWRADGPDVVVEISIARPVRQSFAVRYRLPEHERILRNIVYDGYLLICHVDSDTPARIVFWLEGCFSDALESLLLPSNLV